MQEGDYSLRAKQPERALRAYDIGVRTLSSYIHEILNPKRETLKLNRKQLEEAREALDLQDKIRKRHDRVLYTITGHRKYFSGKVSERNDKKGLLYKIAEATTVVGVVGGIFFFLPNLTGNVIGSLNQKSSNWIAIILFIIGLIGAFIYFRRK